MRSVPNHLPKAVTIPVKDEVEHIRACLEALDAQVGARADHIVLLVNNSTDATAMVARSVRLHPSTRLHVIERTLPPQRANAGHARGLVMNMAAALVGSTGILMTTDADGEVDRDWIAANLASIEDGADVVVGWVELHPIDWGLIPNRLHQDDARECAYDAICDEIHARLDPDPADPWPRHTQHSGASIAVTAEAFRRCGGVPLVACGEDRALIEALRSVDARIRHSPAVHVTVSGRTIGRAVGGMADTIRRRMTKPDEFLDERLEPARDCARRAAARVRLRRLHATGGDSSALAIELQILPAELAVLLATPYFGQAWAAVEQVAPALRRRILAVEDLDMEVTAGNQILHELRTASSSVVLLR